MQRYSLWKIEKGYKIWFTVNNSWCPLQHCETLFGSSSFGYKYSCNEYRTGLYYTDNKFSNWLYMCTSDMCLLRDVVNIPIECTEMK